jgi:hypothetical protein
MRAQKVLAREFQFYFSDLDNIVLVESHEDQNVTIRVTKNNVPEQRKIAFIRQLAAEGFIPGHYEWFSGPTDGSNGVLWMKDLSWVQKTTVALSKKSDRFMKRLLVFACVSWLAMMRVLLASSHPQAVAKTAPQIPRAASLVPGQPLAELQGEHQPVTGHHATRNPPLGASVVEEHRADKLNQD